MVLHFHSEDHLYSLNLLLSHIDSLDCHGYHFVIGPMLDFDASLLIGFNAFVEACAARNLHKLDCHC